MLPYDRLRRHDHNGMLDEPSEVIAGPVVGPLKRITSATSELGINISSFEVSLRPNWLHDVLQRFVPEPGRMSSTSQRSYFAIAALAASIFAFTASRLKLAPLCIGGNSTAVIASFSTCC